MFPRRSKIKFYCKVSQHFLLLIVDAALECCFGEGDPKKLIFFAPFNEVLCDWMICFLLSMLWSLVLQCWPVSYWSKSVRSQIEKLL